MTPSSQTNQLMSVNLLLKISDVQTILNALQALPYVQVSQLIPAIMAQVQEQARVRENSKAEPEDTPEG